MKRNSNYTPKNRKVWKYLIMVVVFSFCRPTIGGADTQHVDVVQNYVEEGSTATFLIVYEVDSPQQYTTGLGLRIHYNSGSASKAELANVFREGLVGIDTTSNADIQDYDKNPVTDRFFNVAWMQIEGKWPYPQQLPIALATIVIELKKGGDRIEVGVSASSVAVGFNFENSRH